MIIGKSLTIINGEVVKETDKVVDMVEGNISPEKTFIEVIKEKQRSKLYPDD